MKVRAAVSDECACVSSQRCCRSQVSREQRMSMAMSTQLGSQLGNLLQLVQNLDEQIKVAADVHWIGSARG